MLDIVNLLLFLLPVYVANAAPVLLGGGMALDLGKKFADGRPMFGNGKTVRGFIGGVVSGCLIACAFAMFYPLSWFAPAACGATVFGFIFSLPARQLLGGSAMALGTLVGDAAGSFFKRRLGIESGKQFIPDTFVFLAFALLFAYPFVLASVYSLENMVFLFGVTIILHPLTNFLANRLGLKKVPW